jgi:hypothetical protein
MSAVGDRRASRSHPKPPGAPVDGRASASARGRRVTGLLCERCLRARAVASASDEPENDGALFFGDELVGVLLCASCLRETEQDGQSSAVDPIDPGDPMRA